MARSDDAFSVQLITVGRDRWPAERRQEANPNEPEWGKVLMARGDPEPRRSAYSVIPVDAKLGLVRPAAFAITAEQPGGVVVSAGPHLAVAVVD